MIIDYLIPLLSSYLTDSLAGFWYFPLLALAVVCTVPCIFRRLLR